MAKKKVYVPDRGDLVWLSLDPRVGREQAGERPVYVLSTKEFSEATGYALVCPVTSRVRGGPFEVKVRSDGISGVVLCDQAKSVDYVARKARFAGEAPPSVVADVLEAVAAIIGATED